MKFEPSRVNHAIVRYCWDVSFKFQNVKLTNFKKKIKSESKFKNEVKSEKKLVYPYLVSASIL